MICPPLRQRTIASAPTHVDRPNPSAREHTLRFELVGELAQRHAFLDLQDELFGVATRPPGVGIDDEQPSEHGQEAEDPEQRGQAQRACERPPGIALDPQPLFGFVHVPPFLASRYP